MFYVMHLGYVCLATLSGLVQFLGIFVTIARQRHQQDPQMVIDHVVSLMVVHVLLGTAWILGVLTGTSLPMWRLGCSASDGSVRLLCLVLSVLPHQCYTTVVDSRQNYSRVHTSNLTEFVSASL